MTQLLAWELSILLQQSDTFAVLDILESCPTADADKMTAVFLSSFDTMASLMEIVKAMIGRDVAKAENSWSLFRNDSVCSRFLPTLFKIHGHNYLRSVLLPLVGTMKAWSESRGYEIDPTKFASTELALKNRKQLESAVATFIDRLNTSAHSIPSLLREILAHIEKTVCARWVDASSLSPTAFIITRVICPALMTATDIVGIKLRSDVINNMRRGLMLVAKTLQTMAHNSYFSKEGYLQALNGFIDDHRNHLVQFIKSVNTCSSYNTNDIWMGRRVEDITVLKWFQETYSERLQKTLPVQTHPSGTKFTDDQEEWTREFLSNIQPGPKVRSLDNRDTLFDVTSNFPPSPASPDKQFMEVDDSDDQLVADFFGDDLTPNLLPSTPTITLSQTVSSLGKLVRQLELLTQPQWSQRLFADSFNAGTIVNMFKTILDLTTLSSATRAMLTAAFFKMSRRHDVYPDYVLLTQLSIRGSYPLKTGGFGEVWVGDIDSYAVSIKAAKVYASSDMIAIKKAFTREATIWSQCLHQNVLPFYGMYLIEHHGLQNVCLLSPWMENGSVPEYLKKSPEPDRNTLALDIVMGLQYLHDSDVVHGDLKGANILVTSSGRACICDFGLSKLMADSEHFLWTQSQSTTRTGAGSVRWQAPEIFQGASISKVTDTYGLACVYYEIYAGCAPFYHVAKHDGIVIHKVVNGERPDLSALNIEPEIRGLIDVCWAQDPSQRPVVANVAKTLQDLLGKTTAEFTDTWWDPELHTTRKRSLHGKIDPGSVKIFQSILNDYIEVA